MLRPKATARKTPTWPTPTPEQVEVVLLGTYHMDNPGLDKVNVEVDDVLDGGRQQEISTFVSHLEHVDPDCIAVERPASETDSVDDAYDRYRSEGVEYDEAHTFEMRRDGLPDGELTARSEVVQVGFRLAARLGHEQVVPVDAPQTGTDPAFEAFADDEYEPPRKRDVPRLDDDALQTESDERLAASTVTGYHRYLNEEAALHHNDGMFDELLRYDRGDRYAGANSLSRWYHRNLRIVSNLWRAVDADTECLLLLVGAGHVHTLRHLLTEFPQFCPASALPYLPRET